MSTSMKPMPVGAAPPSPAILPMNVVAQKVLPGTDAAMKPLTGTNLSYVTLQPPGQALSLVQDHRPYPTYEEDKPRVSNGDVKEPEPQADAARNNNLSPEASESPDDAETSEPDKCRPVSEPSEPKEPPSVPSVPVREEKPLNGKEEVKKDEPKKKEKRTKRKSREMKDLKATAEGKPKRNRVQTQPYQSPLPEIALIVKTLNKVAPVNKNADDKLIVFYRNEFLAVRNAEGSFYVCQAMQNIYKSSRRIRIRWLSQDKNNGEIYSPDFYDFTDFDCILTNLNLHKVDKNKYQLTKFELLRTENILKRAIDVEAGVSEKPPVTEEHPDGLDLSLYKDESQLTRKGSTKPKRQRKRSKRESSSSEEDDDEESSSEGDSDDSPDEDKSRSSRSRKRSATIKSPNKVAVPNRAKRALNRGNKSENDASSSSEVKRVEKEVKKPIKSANAAARTKLRGSTQGSETSNSVAAGRGKRVAATSGTSEESSRKKARSKA